MSIPVLMYHHVNELKDKFTIFPADFQAQMEYLARKNYQTLFLDELVNALKEGKEKKRVALTFDDGYLDNWVYAYPILKKYNLKATIFIVTSRMREKSSFYRPNLEDVWNEKVAKEKLPRISSHYQSNLRCVRNSQGSDDHITWEEAKEMSQGGLIDIQSHSHLHSYCYVSDQIVDYYHENKWRTGWLSDGDLRLGIPIYEDKPALADRRYFDDPGLRNRLAEYVSQWGGRRFFERKVWKKELDREVEDYQGHHALKDHYESPEDREVRVKGELNLSRNIIGERLKKECYFIAWPGGTYDAKLVKWARECGYRGAVTTQPGANTSDTNPMYLKRFEIKRGNIGWFKKRLLIYSRNFTATIYPRMRELF